MRNTCLDIKTKIEIWKYAAKFAIRYDSRSNIGYHNDKTESNWPASPMSLLMLEIKRNLLVIYNEALSEDVQYVEKYLRVTGFYLKILNEFSILFRHSNFPVAKELFDVLLLTISAPDFIKSSNVCIEWYNGIINILPTMFKNSDFQKMLNNHVGGNGNFCFDLVVSYLHACIPNGDIEFFASTAELFANIFTRTFQCGDVFGEESRFDEIIDIYATLILLDSTHSLLRKLQQFVLKGNPALSFACTEVLILVSSLNDRDDELKNKIEFWTEVDNNFAKFSSNYKRLNVERLIISKYTLYTNQRSIGINQTQCTFYHNMLRFITDNNYNLEIEISKDHIVSNLSNLIRMFECNGISVEDYYEIVNAMHKLKRCTTVISKDLQKKVVDFIEKVLKIGTSNIKSSFKRLLSAGFVLIALSASELHLKILTFMKTALHSFYISVMGLWIFLRVCCRQQNDLEVNKIAHSIIAYIKIPDIIRASMFENDITQFTFNTSVDIQHYLHIENITKCTICIKPYFTQRKRLREEIEDEENDIEDLIQNACRLLKKIHQHAKYLKQSDVDKLNNICGNIKTITES
ncbi:uncharacterized protein [Eurosta solidaginis]